MIKKPIIILFLILLLTFAIRFVQLPNLPNGFSQDEAQPGYTAYSILKTGKDEWGVDFPLTPRGLGDFKAPLYTYILIPSIAVFGLNEFAVRFPSAIFGVLLCLGIFLLVKELWKDKPFALIAAFLVAISPWAIQFSRVGWEGSLSLALLVYGIWFFVRGLSTPYNLFISATIFGLSLYSYHSLRVFVVLFLGTLLIIYRQHLKKLKNPLILSGLILAIFITPLIIYKDQTLTRAADVSIFNPTDDFMSMYIQQSHSKWIPPMGKLFHNKVTFVSNKFLENYLSYYSLPFLFTSGRSDSSYLNLSGFALFYFWELPLIILGLVVLFLKKVKHRWLIFAWLVLAPLPAALSKDSGSVFRAAIFLPVLTIISAYGLTQVFKFFKDFRIKLSILALMSLSFLFFINFYFMDLPYLKLGDMQFGFKEVVDYTNKSGKDIIFSRNHSNPQAFVAFYTQIPPQDYQAQSNNLLDYERYGFSYVDQMGDYNLGKYNFRDISWAEDRMRKNTLIVGVPETFPGKVVSDLDIIHPSGKIIFRVVDPEKAENSTLSI